MNPASDDAEPPVPSTRRARGVEHLVLAEMAEEERDRTLDLPMVFLEWLWNGDGITVRTAGRNFDGVVVHSGEDLVTVRTEAELVDVAFAAVLSVVVTEPGRGPARSRRALDPARFVARLRELGDDRRPEVRASVVIGAEHGARELAGRIDRVHADHVAFRADDGAEWILPTATIDYVRRSFSAAAPTREAPTR